MAQDWAGTFSYACPPLAMVDQVLHLVREQGARAVLIVPLWETQPWWPLLRSLACSYMRLGSGRDAFYPGLSGACAPWKNQNWSFLAVEVDGAKFRARAT